MAGTGYFNPNFDYSKAIEDALKVGDQRNLQTLIKERDAKIASDPAKYGNVRSTSEVLGGYNGAGINPIDPYENLPLGTVENTGTANLYDDAMKDIMRMQQALNDARASTSKPFEQPDLINDDESDNIEF